MAFKNVLEPVFLAKVSIAFDTCADHSVVTVHITEESTLVCRKIPVIFLLPNSVRNSFLLHVWYPRRSRFSKTIECIFDKMSCSANYSAGVWRIALQHFYLFLILRNERKFSRARMFSSATCTCTVSPIWRNGNGMILCCMFICFCVTEIGWTGFWREERNQQTQKTNIGRESKFRTPYKYLNTQLQYTINDNIRHFLGCYSTLEYFIIVTNQGWHKTRKPEWSWH